MSDHRDPTLDEFQNAPLRTASQNAHPVTGRPLDGDERIALHNLRENMREPGPADCVRAVLLPRDMTQLIGYDRQGTPRASLVLPTDTIDGVDEMWLLHRVRKLDRSPLRLVG